MRILDFYKLSYVFLPIFYFCGMYSWGGGRQGCVKYSCTSIFMCEVRGCNYKTQRRYGYEHITDAAGKLFKVL